MLTLASPDNSLATSRQRNTNSRINWAIIPALAGPDGPRIRDAPNRRRWDKGF
jgi:hypothetical protein